MKNKSNIAVILFLLLFAVTAFFGPLANAETSDLNSALMTSLQDTQKAHQEFTSNDFQDSDDSDDNKLVKETDSVEADDSIDSMIQAANH